MSEFELGKLTIKVIFDCKDPNLPPLNLVNKRKGEWITPVSDYYKRLFNTYQS